MLQIFRPIMEGDNGGGGSGGAGGGGAGSGGSGGTGGSSGGAGGGGDWTAALSPEHKGFIQNKGYKDPSALIDAYRSIEKHVGVPADRLLKLPEKLDDDKAMTDIFDRLGRPKDPKEYKIGVPEGTPPDFAEHMRGVFHGLGLSARQVEKLSTEWNGFAKKAYEKQVADYQAKVAAQKADLQREWGNTFEGNINIAKKAAHKLGVSDEVIAKLEQHTDFSTVMKLFHQIGSQLGEAAFVGGDNRGGGDHKGLTPEMAKDKISSLLADPDYVKRLNDPNSAVRWGAIEEMERYQKIAHSIH